MVDRSDIEAKIREIQGTFEQAKQTARDRTVMAAAGGAALLLLSFLWGRRKGRKARAVVEVYKLD